MEKRFKIVKGIILMEEIIERLKDKTFTQEDIEKLYNYYKNSENKELAKEVSGLRQSIKTVISCKKKCTLLFVGCKSLYELLNYYYIAKNNIPNIIRESSHNAYEYKQELETLIKLILNN